MLNKFAKLEEKLNTQLEKLGSLLLRLFKLLLPAILFIWLDKIKQKCKNVLEGTKNKIIFVLHWLKDKAMALISLLIDFKNNFGEIQSKFFGGINDRIQNSVKFLKTTPLSHQVGFITKHIKPLLLKLQIKLKSIASSQSSIAVFAMLMILGGIFGIYQSSQEIYTNEYKGSRAPASAQEYDYKPDYRMYPRRTSTFMNIKVPLMVERVGDVDSVTIDISIRTSTRFAKIYLEDYEYKLKDYFFTAARPIASNVPFEEDGKNALKDFIKKEVNQFLEFNNVEGEVEEVRILFIVGS